MRANPGGYISPEETVGRDELIDAVWRRLRGQSVLLTSERRIGKTCVIRKMREAANDDLCILRDIEGLHAPGEFIEAIYSDLEPVLSRGERLKQRFFRVFEAIGGTQIKDIKLPSLQQHWKELLVAVVSDAVETHKGRLVFFWDEMPLFIFNVAKNCGDKEAMAVLDTLRSLRQNHPSLRMVYTGSVGMHQVVKSLRKVGYANAPTNDMAIIEVPALSPAYGQQLAMSLFQGEDMEIEGEVEAISLQLSTSASHIPFYIHTLVARMRDKSRLVTTERVAQEAELLIRDPNDPVDFGYYEKRIKTYYDAEHVPIAYSVLDAIAASSAKPLDRESVFRAVTSQVSNAADQEVREVIGLLQKDHYLHREGDDSFCFKHSIVQRWWKFSRVT